MSELDVVRVEIRAPVVSFRYPHFLVGRQPTYDMPPPSTIYGCLASALGELPPPQGLHFAYWFTYGARGSDYEHQHVIRAGGRRQAFVWGEEKLPVSVEAEVQPHLRDFLFNARLVLYVDAPALAELLRQPVFPVVLGRSQDLAEIVEVKVVKLRRSAGAYLEHTLLPFSLRDKLSLGYTVWMPRYIGPAPAREPRFDRFIILHERVFAGEVEAPESLGIRRLLGVAGQRELWWVDPETPPDRGVHRAVIWQPFWA